jgi:hypothetical protein
MYLLCNNISCLTARDIRDYIEEKSSITLAIRKQPHPRKAPLIRYGNSLGNYKVDTKYDSPEFINLCIDKLHTSVYLDQNNINTCLFYNNIEDTSYPCLIRTTLAAHGGIGIHIIHNEEEFNSIWRIGYYWTPYTFLSSEYRVIIFNGEVLRIFKKEKEGVNRNEIQIRNSYNDYHFSLKDNDKFPKLLSFVDTKLKPTFPFGFYGLDIGKIRDTEEDFLVIELNSAPGLNENTVQLLGDKLIEALEL